MNTQRIVLGALAVVVLAVAGYWGYTNFLAPLPEEPTPLPTPAAEGPEMVSAEGEIVPWRRAWLSFKVGGRVAEILVEEGDQVEAEEPLIRLAAHELEVQVAQARAALASAQAQLAQAQAGARPQEITAARAALAAAQAQLAQLEKGASEDEIAVAQAELDLARVQLQQAQSEYDKIAWMPGAGGTPQAVALQEAWLNFQAAQASYNTVVNGPSEEELAIAQAQVDEARAHLDLLLAGAREEEVAALEAQVQMAQAVLDQALLSLEEATLLAPFSGTVASIEVDVGELMVPGTPVLLLGDLFRLQVETTDLDETSVPLVKVGQPVKVTVDAFPDVEFAGEVIRIAPAPEEARGDKVYTVTIALEEGMENGLRWGMTAIVDIMVE